MLLIWYYSAPAKIFMGTPYVWSLLLFEISILIFVSSFKIICKQETVSDLQVISFKLMGKSFYDGPIHHHL